MQEIRVNRNIRREHRSPEVDPNGSNLAASKCSHR
jgi:hypothetical protein